MADERPEYRVAMTRCADLETGDVIRGDDLHAWGTVTNLQHNDAAVIVTIDKNPPVTVHPLALVQRQVLVP